MASTKIINVLKDDKFEEILDLFKETSAKEVIFVLPKKSKAFTHEEHFIILASDASRSGKKISILCSNPDVNKLAKKYKFDVLLAKGSSKTSFVTEREEEPRQPEEDEDTTEQESDDDEQEVEVKHEEPEEEYQEEDELPEAPPVRSRGGLEGIVRKKGGNQLNVSPKKEKLVKLDVRQKTPHHQAEEIENIWADLAMRQKSPKRELRKKFSFPNFSKRSVVALGVISFLLLGAIIYVSTGSAQIDIRPQKQALETELKVSASDKFSLVDQNLNKVPGQLFSIDKTVNQTFPATGEKDVAQKARGKVTVFNEYGTSPQVLIATTRFESPEGLIFRTLKTITVPGTSVENGQITPGQIDVEVVADKPGPSYNISATKFSIPAFKERGDANRYEKFYGRSTEATKGGMSGRAKVVTESDFNNAKQALETQLRKEITDGLKLQTAGLKTLDSVTVKIGQPESTARVDEAADTFNMALKGSLKTIGFKDTDLFGLIKQHVSRTRNMDVLPEKLELTYNNVNFKDAENTLEFTVAIKGSAYAKIETDKIKKELAGKDEDEIKSYLRGLVGVESAKVILSPFWVKNIPDKAEKTIINISY